MYGTIELCDGIVIKPFQTPMKNILKNIAGFYFLSTTTRVASRPAGLRPQVKRGQKERRPFFHPYGGYDDTTPAFFQTESHANLNVTLGRSQRIHHR